jgi:tetratricopeptide (TPR) repeat protein
MKEGDVASGDGVDNRQTNHDLLARASASASALETIRLCNRILASDPKHLPAIELKVKSLWRRGDYEQALDGLNQALRLNPYDPGYYFLKGDCYQNLLRYGEAIDSYSRCMSGDDAEIATQAEMRLKGLQQWQTELLHELVRSEPKLAAEFRSDPVSLQSYGFRAGDAEMSEKVLAKLASPALWARPS